ncbi:hypothetical protein QZH41_011189 [Actinostola sp. cb2023]|nr:hypothetical protein QZH41_011189 [Actinostola sp. cb2023]
MMLIHILKRVWKITFMEMANALERSHLNVLTVISIFHLGYARTFSPGTGTARSVREQRIDELVLILPGFDEMTDRWHDDTSSSQLLEPQSEYRLDLVRWGFLPNEEAITEMWQLFHQLDRLSSLNGGRTLPHINKGGGRGPRLPIYVGSGKRRRRQRHFKRGGKAKLTCVLENIGKRLAKGWVDFFALGAAPRPFRNVPDA